MTSIRSSFRRIAADRRGVTATVVALFMPVLLGGLALAVDVAMFRTVQNRLQTAADASALAAVVSAGNSTLATSQAVAMVSANLPATFGNATVAGDVTVGRYTTAGGFVPGGANPNAVRVRAARDAAHGNVLPRIFSAFMGVADLDVVATAIAAKPDNVFYEPPEGVNLDNEAGDFNELYAYCFDYTGSGSAESRRSQMTLIANNMPSNQNVVAISGGRIAANPAVPMPWPDCRAQGTSLSFRLRNIRHAKSIPSLWANENNSPRRAEHNHFTDTVIAANGREQFNIGSPILETVRCDSAAKCTPKISGTNIPAGRYRTPQISTQPCAPGKFMYFGWEDRPGPQTSGGWTDPLWTDYDYDDIAIRMKCPNSGTLGNANPRLVG